MLYTLIKLPIRLALRIFCANKELTNPHFLRQKGPLLLVANHPNSFLDAIIIAAHFEETVHFLARGDAFRKPWHNTLLRFLQMIPIYRISEGRENLHRNEYAFERSAALLKQNQIVLIFIEGICLHTHTLQPFKKGAARIALSVIQQQHPLNVMPVTITYHSFRSFGKNIRLTLESPINAKSLLPYEEDAKNFQHFNENIYQRLSSMIQIPPSFQAKQRILLSLPALIGYFLHVPLYTAIKSAVKSKTKGTVFYDSVLFGVLFLLYPLYLLLLSLVFLVLHMSWPLTAGLLLLHPLTAWCAVQYKITRNNLS